jgi:hypothetical protein
MGGRQVTVHNLIPDEPMVIGGTQV